MFRCFRKHIFIITGWLAVLLPASLIRAQDVTKGLVGYYTFCDCSAKDNSSNHRDGTLIGTPECIRGIRDYGFQFNETPGGNNGCGQPGGQYITLPPTGTIWANGFTVCAWVRYDEINNYERIIDFSNGPGDNGGLPIWFGREGNSNNLTLESWISSDANENRSTGRLVAVNAITNGNIEYYCATISGDTMSIYVNGVLVAQKEGNPIANVARSNNFIGHSAWCGNDPDFKGFMDEVRIYNRALSLDEIQSLFTIKNITDFTASPVCNSTSSFFAVAPVPNVDSVVWNFGDAGSGPANRGTGFNVSHRFSATGDFNVQTIAYKYCLNDTVIKPVHIENYTHFLGSDVVLCSGASQTATASISNATYQWQDGSTNDSYTMTEPGTYWVNASANGCMYRDSIIATDGTVRTSLQQTICNGESLFGYTTSGNYIDTFRAGNGCDSIRTLQLTVGSLITSSVSTTICSGSSYLEYNQSGTYTDTFPASGGCDSVRTLHLTVTQSVRTDLSQTICEGGSYEGHTIAGNYVDTLTASSGCDSILTLHLSVLPKSHTDIEQTICSGDNYAGYTASGTYTDTLPAANGCDSIRVLRLTVLPITSSVIDTSICKGETYLGYIAAGTYIDTLLSASGCDSIRTLHLQVKSLPHLKIPSDTSLCNGDLFILSPGLFTTYLWQDGTTEDHYTISAAGVYRVTVSNDCGSATASVIVKTDSCGIMFPTAFSPNHDGRNDIFKIIRPHDIQQYRLMIYDRWGKAIFESNDTAKGWDGMASGREEDEGTYIWYAYIKTSTGAFSKRGTLVLLR